MGILLFKFISPV